jgi:hypothetical protein
MSIVLCAITKQRSPLLLTIKDPSPSVNPTNQVKNLSEGKVTLGKCSANFEVKDTKLKLFTEVL